MKIQAVWTVFRKEVLDLIRDRRTLIFMVVLPLVLVPGLMYFFGSFTIGSEKKIAEQGSTVAVIGAENAPGLVAFLQNEEKNKFEPEEDSAASAFLIEDRSGVNAFINVTTTVESVEQAHEMIRNEELEAALVIPPDFSARLDQAMSDMAGDREGAKTTFPSDLNLRIDYLSTNDYSKKAYERLEKSLNTYRDRVVGRRLSQAGYDRTMIEPWKNVRSDLATQKEKMGEVLGSILPYMIIILAFSGASFPAIQLGAGEKEQKTLETLLVSAVGRADMVAGKFLTIMITGIISAALSLVGMWYGFTQMGASTGMADLFKVQIDPMSVAFALGLIVPLALVFAGVLLSVSVLARSFREAQSYISPMSFLIILPAFASFLPGIKLNMWLSMVPILNVSLVLRQVLSGKLMQVLPYYFMTIASTLVFAALAIWFCAWMFRREQAIFKL
jgi:sodium transport system permease protein